MDFSLEKLKASQNSYERLKNIILEFKKSSEKVNKNNIELCKKQFTEFINDDLNIPRALAYLWEILRDDRLRNSEKYETALEFDKVFGLDLDKEEKIKIPEDVKKLVKMREQARKNKEFNKADELREIIKEKGFSVDDAGKESRVRKI